MARARIQWPVVTIVAACLAAWGYVAVLAWGMEHMDVGATMWIMPAMVGWGALDLLLVFAMWAVMMAAMMLPAALPTIRCFVALGRHARPPRPGADTLFFALGYLAVWTAFSALATFAQWRLLEARLVSPMMEASSPGLAGALLIAAGVFQFSRWKLACLARCRSPLDFLAAHGRPGARGAFAAGWRHGGYCVGCCWLLMALLLVLGVMNLAWVAALALLVLLERQMRAARWLVRGAGVGFIVWGALLLAAGLS